MGGCCQAWAAPGSRGAGRERPPALPEPPASRKVPLETEIGQSSSIGARVGAMMPALAGTVKCRDTASNLAET